MSFTVSMPPDGPFAVPEDTVNGEAIDLHSDVVQAHQRIPCSVGLTHAPLPMFVEQPVKASQPDA